MPILTRIESEKVVFFFRMSYPILDRDLDFLNNVLRLDLISTYGEEEIFIIHREFKDVIITHIPCINVFKDFVKPFKLKNKKRCYICNLKKKCFRVCGKCDNKYCIECFNKINDKYLSSCPYCRYSFTGHYQNNIETMIRDKYKTRGKFYCLNKFDDDSYL